MNEARFSKVMKSTVVQTLSSIWLKCSNIGIENIFYVMGEHNGIYIDNYYCCACSKTSIRINRRQESLRMMQGSLSI